MKRHHPSGAAAPTRRLRQRRIALGAVFLALPVALLLYFRAPWPPSVRTALLLTWVAVYAAATLCVAWSRCPRCGGLYFVAKPFFRVNPMATRCGGCGMAI